MNTKSSFPKTLIAYFSLKWSERKKQITFVGFLGCSAPRSLGIIFLVDVESIGGSKGMGSGVL